MLEPNNKPDNELNPVEEATSRDYGYAVALEARIADLEQANADLLNIVQREKSRTLTTHLRELMREEVRMMMDEGVLLSTSCVESICGDVIEYNYDFTTEYYVDERFDELSNEMTTPEEVEDMISDNLGRMTDVADIESRLSDLEKISDDREHDDELLSSLDDRVDALENKLMDVAAILE